MIEVEYTSVLEEIDDSYNDDDELEIIDTPNLESELVPIELDTDSYLDSGDSFFTFSDEDLVDGNIRDEHLYSNTKVAAVDKNKLQTLTTDTVEQTTKHMSDIVRSLTTLTGVNKDYFEDKSEVKEYVNSTYDHSPDFVNSNVQTEVLRCLYKNMTGEEIFYECGLSPEDMNNEAKKYIFIEWIDNLYRDLDNFRKSTEYSAGINRKSQEILIQKLFSGINIFESYNALAKSQARDVYSVFYTDGSKITHFKCNNCSEEGRPYAAPLQEDFMVITNINGKPGFIVTPSMCDKCGTFHLLSPTTLKNFAHKCKSIGFSLSPGSQNSNGLKIATYRPSFIWTSNLLSLYYSIELLPGMTEDDLKEDTLEVKQGQDIDYDWEAICKEFRELNVMIGDSIFRLNNRQESLSNIAKIVANQLDSYPSLKESALASLILTLEKDGLYRFSLQSKCYYEVYSKINDLTKVTPTAMKNLSDVFYYKLVNDDGSINYELATEVFNNIRESYSNLEKDKDNFLWSLDRYKYFLSYVPISKIDLREDMVYNYLSDPGIFSILDKISDLMILNHLSEDLFDSLSIPVNSIDKTKTVANKTFYNVKKQIRSVNRKKPLKEYVSRLSAFFGFQCKSILNLLDNPDSVNTLSSFLDACYREDLYDMYKFRNSLMLLDPSSCNEEIKELFEFVMLFPSQELKSDKFSFYFDFDCDISYKARFVKMYETRGFIPKEFEGETLDDKLEFYRTCSKFNAKDLIPAHIRKLLTNYSNIIKFGKFISYRGMYRDFGAYYSMRDILFDSKDYPINYLLKALSVDPTVSSLLLEEEYNYPSIDYDIVKDYIYLALPIFDGDLEDKQNDTTKTYRERINDVIAGVESLISQYKGLDELEDLLSDLIKDLMDRNV